MTDDILFFETHLDMPAKMVHLPVRCSVVKTRKGVVIISPIPFKPAQVAKIKEFAARGTPVTELVAPSLIHHLWMQDAQKLFPNAKTWGPPGCREKLPEIKWDAVFTENEWPHHSELEAQFIAGVPRLNEVVFYDEAARTLIVGDLVFNLQRPEGWAAPVMLRMMGTYKKPAVSKLTNRFMKDKAEFERDIAKILRWDFKSIAMGHGEIIREDGKPILRRALAERGLLPDQENVKG